MVGDTDPPKYSVLGPISRIFSRTCPIGAERKFSAAPAPASLIIEKKTPTTAATEAGAKELANAEIGAARFYAISLSRATFLSGWAMDIGLLLEVLVALWVLA